MIVLLCLALAGALIGVMTLAVVLWRRRATPEDLRGDWWPRFEDEFRAYVLTRELPGHGRRERGSSPSRPAPRQDIAEGSA